MKINVIKNKFVNDVHVVNEEFLLTQRDLEKSKLPLFNYWSEHMRKELSDEATCSRLILDFDDGITREAAEALYSAYDYVIYNSTGNDDKNGVSKFRIILKLKEPIDARSLKHWRMKMWKELFSGCDYSTFAIGRFFCVPSKYDKGGNEVKIVHHVGEPFDFYASYPKFDHSPTYLRMLEEMKYGTSNSRIDDSIDIESAKLNLNTFISSHGYTHYAFIPHVVGKAKHLGLDIMNAMDVFKMKYEGKSKWDKYFKSCWDNIK